jgi:hypothetical protein
VNVAFNGKEADDTGTRLAPVRLSEAPGGIAEPPAPSVQASDAPEAMHDMKYVPTAAPEKAQPLGAVMVKAVIAYALDEGLEIVTETAVAAHVPDVQPGITLGDRPIVGATALAAITGEAMGTRNSNPDNARIARVNPELNFLAYSLLRVFILYFRRKLSQNPI